MTIKYTHTTILVLILKYIYIYFLRLEFTPNNYLLMMNIIISNVFSKFLASYKNYEYWVLWILTNIKLIFHIILLYYTDNHSEFFMDKLIKIIFKYNISTSFIPFMQWCTATCSWSKLHFCIPTYDVHA